MRKKILFATFIIFQFFIAQASENIQVGYTSTPPDIDGDIDDVWEEASRVPIENDFTDESPTVTAFWSALWDDEYIYVLLEVEDDNHWPSWISGGNWWEYDQTEVYLDINVTLADGQGPGNKGTGHYQAVGKFAEGIDDIETAMDSSNYRPAGTYAYSLWGDDYNIEYAIKISSMVNSDSLILDIDYLQSLDEIGFDVTIVDQDDGDTDARQRAVWQNDGSANENYSNMDDAGTIILVDEIVGIAKYNIPSLSAYPNPASDMLTISTDFDRIEIINNVGQVLKTSQQTNRNINIKTLPDGVYVIKIYNKNIAQGVVKFIKN